MDDTQEQIHELRMAVARISAFAAELFFALRDQVQDLEKRKELNARFEDALKPGMGSLVRSGLLSGNENHGDELLELFDHYGMYGVVEQYRLDHFKPHVS